MNYYKASITTEENKIVEDYINGVYINPQGVKEKLAEKLTKYNKEFIVGINSLHQDLYDLMLVEGIAIRLMKLSGNSVNSEIGNLWNLEKAQSGTLKYNRALKVALLKYAVDKKKVYDSIKYELDKQVDRIERNKNLVLTLLKDYGFDSLTDYIKENTGLEFTEHIKQYSDSEESGTDIKEKTENYIQLVMNMAKSNGFDLFGKITKSLENSRNILKERQDKAKAEIEARKTAEKMKIAKEAADKDNALLQSDINSSYDDVLHRIGRKAATDFQIRITNHGGTVWYIAVARNNSVKYINDNMEPDTSINKAVLIYNEKQADFLLEQLKEKEEFENYYLSKQKIVTNLNKSKKTVYANTAEVNDLKYKLNDSSISKTLAVMTKKALIEAHGINTDNSMIDNVVIMVTCTNKESYNYGTTFYISAENNKLELKRLITEVTLFKRNKKLIDSVIMQLNSMLGNDYIIDKARVCTVSNWYDYRVEMMNRAHNDLFKELVAYSNEVKRYKYKHSEKALFEVGSKLVDIRNTGFNKAYYVVMRDTKVNEYYTGFKDGEFKTSESIMNMVLFTSEDEAVKVYLALNNKYDKAVVKIMTFNLN